MLDAIDRDSCISGICIIQQIYDGPYFLAEINIPITGCEV